MGRKKILAVVISTLILSNITTVTFAETKIKNTVIPYTEEEIKTEYDKGAKQEKSTKATNISLGKTYYTTTTESNYNKVLYYDFMIPKDGVVELQIKNPMNSSGSNRYSWYVDIVNPANKGINYLKDVTSNQKNKEYATVKVGLKAGKYRLALKPAFFIMGNPVVKGDFKVKFYPNNKFESERNDTIETADYINLNTDYKGISDNNDYFKVETKRKGDLNILLAHNENNSFNAIGFYDAKGKIITYIYDYQTVRRGEYKQYTHKNAPAGTYYVKIQGFDHYASYALKVNQGVTNQTTFTDISGHYAERDIVSFVNKGYTEGYNDATFRPEQSITRAEFIKFVNKTFGFTARGSEWFSDVNDSDWFSNDVKIALKAGYISTKNSNFRPNAPITREEVAKIIADIKNTRDNNLDKLNGYKDKLQVSSWAKSSVEGVIEKGYMGKGSLYFRPKSNITRAEAVVTLNRVK